MKDAFAKVTEFYNAGVAAPDAATLLPIDVQDLRFRLIDEEYAEYLDAVSIGGISSPSLMPWPTSPMSSSAPR